MQCFYLCKVAMCFLLRFRCVTFVLLSEELVWAFRGCVSDTTPGHSGKSGSTVFVLFFWLKETNSQHYRRISSSQKIVNVEKRYRLNSFSNVTNCAEVHRATDRSSLTALTRHKQDITLNSGTFFIIFMLCYTTGQTQGPGAKYGPLQCFTWFQHI